MVLISCFPSNGNKENEFLQESEKTRCIGLSEPCTADYQCCPFGNHDKMCCEFSTTLLDYVCHVC